jgi:hypothetical protein
MHDWPYFPAKAKVKRKPDGVENRDEIWQGLARESKACTMLNKPHCNPNHSADRDAANAQPTCTHLVTVEEGV